MRDNGLLSDCLVDSDLDAAQRARLRRRKALAISLAVEFVLLAGLLAWPLLNPSTMSARYAIDPVPPYAGGGHRAPHTPTTYRPPREPTPGDPIPFLYLPIGERQRPAPDSGSGDEPPSIGGGRNGSGDGPGIGPDLLGGSKYGPPPPPGPETKPPVEKKRIVVRCGVQEAKLIRRVEPVYPFIARQTHISGTVELQAIIAADGSVSHLTVVSGNPILARAAVEAVGQWRYRPTTLNDQPVEVQTFVTVKFVLQ